MSQETNNHTQPNRKRLRWLTPAILGGVIGFAIGIFPDYYELYREWYAEPLSLSISSWFPGRVFYRVYPLPGGRQEAIPIEMNVYVYITNNGSRPLSIRKYSLSAKIGDEWERLVPLRYPAEEEGTIITFGRAQGIMRLDLPKEGFDFQAKRKTLNEGEALSGWMFFESQPSGPVNRLRFEFVDSSNKVHMIEHSGRVASPGFASLESAYIPLSPAEPIPTFMEKFLDRSKIYAIPGYVTQRKGEAPVEKPAPIRADMQTYQVPVVRNLISQMGVREMWLSQILARGPMAFDGVPAGRGMIDYPAVIRVMASQGEVEILETAPLQYTDFYEEVFTDDIRFRIRLLSPPH